MTIQRPKLLDLFCCAGGAAMGYHRAGFDVYGVDLAAQPRYPFPFVKADAVWLLDQLIDGWHFTWGDESLSLADFDAIHASPPCQDHSPLNALHEDHGTGWILAATIAKLDDAGKPWVVENVQGAAAEMPGAVLLCGSHFALHGTGRDGVTRQLRRHRLFLSSEFILAPACDHRGEPVGVYGTGGGGPMTRGYKAHKEDGEEAMGIDWMSKAELSQAIPPAYTEFIGAQLMNAMVTA